MTPSPDDAEDEILVAAARAGDGAAHDALLRRHRPALRAYLRARGDAQFRAREDDSDLVQSACLAAFQNLHQFEWRGPGSFRAHLAEAERRGRAAHVVPAPGLRFDLDTESDWLVYNGYLVGVGEE